MVFLPITEVYKYIEIRTQKYIHKKEADERLNQLKEDAENNQEKLFLIVFDEAHSRYVLTLDDELKYFFLVSPAK